MTITLTDAEMAELAEHTRKWMSDAHATAKKTERETRLPPAAYFASLPRGRLSTRRCATFHRPTLMQSTTIFER